MFIKHYAPNRCGPGGQGGFERRIKVFVKIQKKWGGRVGGGVRVNVNEELKFLGKSKKMGGRGGVVGGGGSGRRWGGGRERGWGQGGCE